VTTNKELFKSNFNVPLTERSSINLFDPTHTFYEGKMNIESEYRKNYPEIDVNTYFKDRGPKMTRQLVESKNMKMISPGRAAIDLKTSSMLQFNYDPNSFRAAVLASKVENKKDMFKSKLYNNLKPIDNTIESNGSSLKNENKNFV
jgi:hypothetical protein